MAHPAFALVYNSAVFLYVCQPRADQIFITSSLCRELVGRHARHAARLDEREIEIALGRALWVRRPGTVFRCFAMLAKASPFAVSIAGWVGLVDTFMPHDASPSRHWLRRD